MSQCYSPESKCYCPEESWGTDQGPVCETPEFDDAIGVCFNCHHNRQCHADYWETFGEAYTLEATESVGCKRV